MRVTNQSTFFAQDMVAFLVITLIHTSHNFLKNNTQIMKVRLVM
jgi:hypothetical protein